MFKKFISKIATQMPIQDKFYFIFFIIALFVLLALYEMIIDLKHDVALIAERQKLELYTIRSSNEEY